MNILRVIIMCSYCFCSVYAQKFDISDSETFVITTTSREEIKDDITYSTLPNYLKYMRIYISHILCTYFKLLSVTVRDVNFGLSQKSIIVLKKSIFFRLSNFGISPSHAAGDYERCRVPPLVATLAVVGLLCRSL